jgi:hypothetical protein
MPGRYTSRPQILELIDTLKTLVEDPRWMETVTIQDEAEIVGYLMDAIAISKRY